MTGLGPAAPFASAPRSHRFVRMVTSPSPGGGAPPGGHAMAMHAPRTYTHRTRVQSRCSKTSDLNRGPCAQGQGDWQRDRAMDAHQKDWQMHPRPARLLMHHSRAPPVHRRTTAPLHRHVASTPQTALSSERLCVEHRRRRRGRDAKGQQQHL